MICDNHYSYVSIVYINNWTKICMLNCINYNSNSHIYIQQSHIWGQQTIILQLHNHTSITRWLSWLFILLKFDNVIVYTPSKTSFKSKQASYYSWFTFWFFYDFLKTNLFTYLRVSNLICLRKILYKNTKSNST